VSGDNLSSKTGDGTRAMKQCTVAHGEARTGSTEYLRKRHMSQGESRRRFGSVLPPDLANLTDAELDDRNARVWAVVLADCQRAAGVDVDAFPDLSGGKFVTPVAYAFKAAVQICHERYGIPIARLAELAEREPPTLGRHVSSQSERIDEIKEAWLTRGGVERVNESTTTRQIDVPAHVHAWLLREATRRGETIGMLVARLATDG
jgi:hypothetical protein